MPGIEVSDDVFVAVVDSSMTPVLAGLVLAAALSAVMSTSSGALLAASTVFRQDVVEPVLASRGAPRNRIGSALRGGLVRETGDEVRDSRLYLLSLGAVTIVLACIMPSVVEALTVAYNLLVCGLFVPILGGLVWRRGTIIGVLAGMIVGALTTIVIMVVAGIYANPAISVSYTHLRAHET